jgi:hypothetical protein
MIKIEKILYLFDKMIEQILFNFFLYGGKRKQNTWENDTHNLWFSIYFIRLHNSSFFDAKN